ncbi:hypothetical protein [Thalassospira sp.]|uniref:hypothetical protein n=1 Tax=Thalassospira sp. TaxID=1912094 RepID=UPI002735C688|nr:hypothetical protein [Thalassospira sp.]MDP2699616.1 hypothetical protein [Thalassospira sp.]
MPCTLAIYGKEDILDYMCGDLPPEERRDIENLAQNDPMAACTIREIRERLLLNRQPVDLMAYRRWQKLHELAENAGLFQNMSGVRSIRPKEY